MARQIQEMKSEEVALSDRDAAMKRRVNLVCRLRQGRRLRVTTATTLTDEYGDGE